MASIERIKELREITGISISEIGYGTWGIGGHWGPLDDAEALKALHRAANLGVNFFDTALVYGEGHSEQLLRRMFRERKKKEFVATKIPPKNHHWPARAGTPLKIIHRLQVPITDLIAQLLCLELQAEVMVVLDAETVYARYHPKKITIGFDSEQLGANIWGNGYV